MTDLTEARLTVPEAAFVSGVTIKDINREIDADIISGGGGDRVVRGTDLFYLFAIKDVRSQVDPGLRKQLHRAIVEAAGARRSEARVFHFVFQLDGIRRDLSGPFDALARSRDEHIERRSDILAGEPVVKGTRIAARHVADLVRRGATRAEISDDFDLTEAQIDAAVVFDQTSPKRGRPTTRKDRMVHVSAV